MININPKLIVMKNHILLLSILFLLVGLSISSCKKSADPKDGLITCPGFIENYNSLIGKWNLVTDSTFVGVGIDNHPVSYSGQAGDYFDFRSDGKLYIKEGIKMDTSTYKLTSNTMILIPSFGATVNGVLKTSNITNLTAHHATITAPILTTPGGLFGRKVDLSR